MTKQQMIEIGKTYLVNSQRKGVFMVRMTRVDETWATGIIVSGRAKALLEYNEKDKGEEVTVRRSLCTFTEQPRVADAARDLAHPRSV